MSKPSALRVEFTVLDEKLLNESAQWIESALKALYFCTSYEDAINPPFPIEGKSGVSVWAGPLSAFHHPRARLLWELEKRRKRPTVIVLTEQKARSFMRAYREVGGLLGDQLIAPLSFLRRRGKQWDSLDFCSSGGSPFMKSADIRLKRLKQAGWEYLVDRLSLTNTAIKKEYFETLELSRAKLLEGSALAFSQLKLSPLIGIAGMGLNKDTIYNLLSEPLIAKQILIPIATSTAPDVGKWQLLSHRQGGEQLILLGNQVPEIKAGDILKSIPSPVVPKSSKALSLKSGEFAVAEVLEAIKLGASSDGTSAYYYRVRVDWRYPPGRELPTAWEQALIV